MTDPINPDHYRRHGIELIDLIEHMPFSRANVIKYVARAGHKNPATELDMSARMTSSERFGA